MLLVLIAAGMAPFFLKDKHGQALLKIGDIKLPSIQLPESFDTRAPPSPQKIQLYRWQDETGSWQFSNTPPEGQHFEVMEIDANMNIVPAVQQNPVPKSNQGNKQTSEASTSVLPDLPLSYSVEQVQQLIGDAKTISSTAEDRQKNLDQAISAQQ